MHDIIDNREQKLVDHINQILGGTQSAKFAVGYFFLSGLEAVAGSLEGVGKVRLLIGNTSSRETLCARNNSTACESGSWKIDTSRSPASISSFSALSACWRVCCITRWKASVWSVCALGSSSISTSSSKKRWSASLSAGRSAPAFRKISTPRASWLNAKSRCSTVTYAWRRLTASRKAA